MTHTYVTLRVSAAAFEEIKSKLLAAGYSDQVWDGDNWTLIDMYGIAIEPEEAPACPCGKEHCNAVFGGKFRSVCQLEKGHAGKRHGIHPIS